MAFSNSAEIAYTARIGNRIKTNSVSLISASFQASWSLFLLSPTILAPTSVSLALSNRVLPLLHSLKYLYLSLYFCPSLLPYPNLWVTLSSPLFTLESRGPRCHENDQKGRPFPSSQQQRPIPSKSWILCPQNSREFSHGNTFPMW